MSKFLKALQRAEEERLLHKQPWQDGSDQDQGQRRSPESRAASADTGQKARLALAWQVNGDQHAQPQPQESPEASHVASAEIVQHAALSFPSANEPEVLDHVDAHCVSILQPTTFEAEQYRTLRYMVEQAHQKANLYTVAISSPSSGDGKSVTAVNLAGALAQAHDVQILLIDADLRQPSVARLLGLSSEGPGLVDVILNPGLSLLDVARPCPPSNLFVLPAGRSTASSYEVLKSPRMGEILAEARRRYDYIVVDTPPLIPFPDCRLLGKWVDGFFIVVAANKTSRKLVEEALHVVDAAQLLGLVFNRDDRPISRYGSNGYLYYFSLNGHGGGR
ncbi:MAG TPA: CpsD/CapB family tyrosine-protein kinase, partial [Candidatus Binatia bacterium]|nr:CpsD/CapB family tyrosine-protein kinase [Candidatus Binatia bacterium]